ncbi:hypothetical protein [uncultured Novosphingobium sp.]|uniref:hypothetical protein n=1 Tax=uncultured Novosphingobium sp. TaxID=292277 RepID=UPI0025973270|nr:hypothetical protein [uncultured Novosphingobium sp.]
MRDPDYDGIEGIFRIAEAGSVLNPFAIEVLTYHAAVEYELDFVLNRLLPHPEKILKGRPKLSFPHKARLLAALWPYDPSDADKLNNVLKAFQDLRDEIAHPGGTDALAASKAKLDDAFRGIEPEAGSEPSMLEIAQGISMFIANDGTLADFHNALDGLARSIGKFAMMATDKILGKAPSDRPDETEC